MVKRKDKAVADNRTVADWCEAALDAFASKGVHSASIPEIARALGVTKGSFYWHFQSLDDLMARAMEKWSDDDQEVLAQLETIEDPRERLAQMFRESMARKRAQALFVALSGSGVPVVENTIARLSEQRVRALTEAYKQLSFDASAARERALLVYSAYIGALHLRAESSALDSQRKMESYVKHAVETLIPSDK